MSPSSQPETEQMAEQESKSSSTTRFRFKTKRKHREGHDRSRHRREETPEEWRHLREPENERQSPRSKRRKSDSSKDRSHDSTRPPFDADTAFRESLFDAMADDEGAQYWEGVYGQPIHTYSDKKETPTGELEQMTDEEYTAFVRAKMYEKTHQHLIEEKARREKARKEQAARAKEGERARQEDKRFRDQVEASLRRGEERRSKKAWADRWESYTRKWEALGTRRSEAVTQKIHLASIPWPVEYGKRTDVSKEEVQRFFLYAPTSGQPTESQLQKVLKLERVRWHPDKIQQKLGGQDVGEEVIQGVTEVFQIIDQLWSELRKKGG